MSSASSTRILSAQCSQKLFQFGWRFTVDVGDVAKVWEDVAVVIDATRDGEVDFGR